VSAVYPKAKEQYAQAGINMLTDDIRVMLVLSTYTYNAAHQFISDLGAVDNGRSAALGTKDVTNGVFDAADSSITATAGSPCNALIIFKHTGADGTARVIAYLDSTSILGLPFTPEAGQICPAVWDNGANKIFAL
jgi:hypothetical protein